MAKEAAVASNEYKPSTYIDFDNAKEVEGLKLGDTVRIVLKGKITSLEQRESYDNPKKQVSCVRLTDFESEVVTSKTQFDDLFGDD